MLVLSGTSPSLTLDIVHYVHSSLTSLLPSTSGSPHSMSFCFMDKGDTDAFRTTLKRLSSLIGLEATSTLQLKEVEGVSPVTPRPDSG